MANDWWAPLTGVAFIVLAIVSIVIGGEPPDLDEGAQKMVEFYKDDKDAIMFGAAIEGLCAGLLIFFGGVLRRELKPGGGRARDAVAHLLRRHACLHRHRPRHRRHDQLRARRGRR